MNGVIERKNEVGGKRNERKVRRKEGRKETVKERST